MIRDFNMTVVEVVALSYIYLSDKYLSFRTRIHIRYAGIRIIF